MKRPLTSSWVTKDKGKIGTQGQRVEKEVGNKEKGGVAGEHTGDEVEEVVEEDSTKGWGQLWGEE